MRPMPIQPIFWSLFAIFLSSMDTVTTVLNPGAL